jgi:hypothetical protein
MVRPLGGMDHAAGIIPFGQVRIYANLTKPPGFLLPWRS